MGGEIYQEKVLEGTKDSTNEHNRWMILKNDDDDDDESSYEDSTSCNVTFSSSETMDDGSSLLRSSSSNSYGPLYELSELMAQLPIKRGISMHYQGKSESFGCLASVKSLEDLAKKGYSFRKRIKACNNTSKFSPKATISKKKTISTTSRLSFLTSSILTNY